MAKIKTTAAAKRLEMSVATFVGLASEHASTLEDVWPEVEDGLVLTLERMFLGATPPPAPAAPLPDFVETQPAPTSGDSLADAVLDKMERASHWGKHTINANTLFKHYLHADDASEDVLEALHQEGLLIYEKRGSSPVVALNPASKQRIMARVEEYRRRG